MGNYCCCFSCLRDSIDLPFTSIYEITMRDLNGEIVLFEEFRNKVLLIVNIACKWALASKNFDQLKQLDLLYRSRGLVILGFPCLQFFAREYSDLSNIRKYLEKEEISFRVFERVKVNGRDACDLYKFLRKNSELDRTQIGMNFGKFIISRNGDVLGYHGPLADINKLIDEIDSALI